jgi:hypothetical protein
MMAQATGDASRDQSGKMAGNVVEKAFFVLELSKTTCVTVVQRPQLHEDNFIFQ